MSELISENVGMFFGIVLFMTFLEYIPVVISNRVIGTNLFTNSFSDGFRASQSYGHMQYGYNVGGYLLVLILIVILQYAINSFTMGGFLSYLDSGKDEKNKFSFFSTQGLNKWGRMFGGYLLQMAILLLFAVAIGIVLGIILAAFLTSRYDSSGSIFSLSGLLTLILSLIIATFIAYIPYEVALSDLPVTRCISSAMAKARKLFWPTFGVVTLLYLLGYGISWTLGVAYSPYSIAIIVAYLYFIVGNLAVTFLLYPLYKSASETDKTENSDRILVIGEQPPAKKLEVDDPFENKPNQN